MRYGIADSTGCPVVVESSALAVFAAQGLRDRELITIGLAPLFLHHSGHAASALVD